MFAASVRRLPRVGRHRWAPFLRQLSSVAIQDEPPKLLSSSANGTIAATLWYLKPSRLYETVKPYHINIPSSALPPGLQTNEESAPYEGVQITNLRGQESRFCLDRNGFEVFGYPGARSLAPKTLHSSLTEDDYNSADAIRHKYYPAVEGFLVQALGAEKAMAFAHDVRRRELDFPRLPRGTGQAPQPVQGVHVDMTPLWAEQRLRMLLPQESDSLLQRRWQVLNVWRPLFGPLQDWPLGLCDFASIDPDSDLIASDNVYTHLTTETYNVFHRPQHRWYYVKDMMPEEALVFKTFDSISDGTTARVCAHAAFEDPTTSLNARLRESIECLVFVLYPQHGNIEGKHVKGEM